VAKQAAFYIAEQKADEFINDNAQGIWSKTEICYKRPTVVKMYYESVSLNPRVREMAIGKIDALRADLEDRTRLVGKLH